MIAGMYPMPAEESLATYFLFAFSNSPTFHRWRTTGSPFNSQPHFPFFHFPLAHFPSYLSGLSSSFCWIESRYFLLYPRAEPSLLVSSQNQEYRCLFYFSYSILEFLGFHFSFASLIQCGKLNLFKAKNIQRTIALLLFATLMQNTIY